MRVTITRTTALYPTAVFIQWDIVPDESGTLLVDVERSGSPEGPWEDLASAVPNAYHWLDSKFNLPTPDHPGDHREGVNLFSFTKEVYYRITVTPPSGSANAVISAPSAIEPGLDKRTRLFKRKILRDEATAFKRLNGIEIIVLKRMHWGTRCDDCYDDQLKEGLREHCGTCYGTTFEGGYWKPVAVRGRKTPSPIQQQISGHGNDEVKVTNFIILDYPHLQPDDLLVDLRRNDRYIIRMVTPTELKSVMVHQTASASLIARDAAEYEIPVDPTTTPSLY